MTDDCVFCQIVAGEIPSYTVYEDETTFAFLDVNPLTRGHTLVIPKSHHERLDDLSADQAADVFGVSSDLASVIESAVGAPASTIAINNGVEAGQEVPHVHLHIVPQTGESDLRTIHQLFDGADVSEEEMAQIAEDVRNSR